MPGFEGLYEASTEGRVRSLDRFGAGKGNTQKGRVLKPGVLKGSGRLQVVLCKDGQKKQMKVHQVVALAFHGPCPEGMEVRHWPDRDVTNNRPENLCYGTKGDNQKDSMAHGTHKETRKTHCPRGHEFKSPNLRQRKNSHRECLACLQAAKMVKNRFDVDFATLADACYQDIINGVKNPYRINNSSKTHCPYGHVLESPNLSQHHLRNGARCCLSCIRARDQIRRNGYGDKQAIADATYQNIMSGVAQ